MESVEGASASPREATLLAAAAVGGAIGASARWAVGVGFDITDSASFPWHTFLVNVVGSLLIGVAVSRIERGTAIWSFVVTGLLGGFTTMSSLAVESDDLAEAGSSTTLAVYVVATVAIAIAAVVAGERMGRRSS